METLPLQLPTLNKYIKRIKRQQTEDKDCIKWDVEKQLAKLPVPDLNLTLDKYLRCLQPILPAEKFEYIQKLVEEFCSPNGIGHHLQELLLKYASETENWSYNWWLSDMYLSNPLALPINSNPALVLPKQSFKDENDHLKFVSKLICGILDYKVLIDARELPIDRATSREKGQPLCMEQYYRLFSSYRIPGADKDRLLLTKTKVMHEPEHVIVAYRNTFWVLDVVVNFTRLDEDDLYALLKRIVQMTDEDPVSDDVGICSSLPRRMWGKIRMELITDALNRDSLDLIERCIFLVCLDKAEKDWDIYTNISGSDDDEDNALNKHFDVERHVVSLAEQMLHGGKNMLNCCNRWYDKTMQFIIGSDGACGVNYEHSPAEGIAVIQLIEHLFRYMTEKSQDRFRRSKSLCELPTPHRLKWSLSKLLLKQIKIAKDTLRSSIDDFDLSILEFDDYGKAFVKLHNMSPDAFIQMSLQFTYFKMYDKLVSTYESASTRRFYLGRVDNIRANTPEALEWAQSMMDEENRIPAAEKLRLFRRAMQAQTDLMIQNILGQGMDNHMLALKQIAHDYQIPTPELFLDESYKISNHFALSTSQVTTNLSESFMCYGAVVPDGYGCSYNVRDDHFLFCISSFKSCSTTDSKRFADVLTDTLYEIRDLCTLVQKQQTLALRRPSYASKMGLPVTPLITTGTMNVIATGPSKTV
ncbi:unnamed protein product [Didymodactylos carnosus]|uniref:Choline O-acetyltransferase n=1 Tax=Didymodactylos carnosus TaxID=1234261 RepID=A0A8S2KP33_9BILA|nr:unnamed protein product [Didymodactylos carnosus]CAF3863172.1 unnamed protein product [Didymodactylos carnosus]